MKSLERKIAVVTGAGSGIGRALAEKLAAEGARVFLTDVQEHRLVEAASAINAAGGEATWATADIADGAAVAELADTVQKRFGAPHILCANAGVVTHGASWEQSLDDWRWTIGVNLWGPVHCLRNFVPTMLAHGEEGHIVITSSSAGLAGGNSSAYTAAKFALVGIAEGLRAELADSAIGVSVLCPGGVQTNIMQSEELRPAGFSEKGHISLQLAERITALASPDRTDQAPPEAIAELVIKAMRDGTLFILPMQERYKTMIADRLRERIAALAASPTTAP